MRLIKYLTLCVVLATLSSCNGGDSIESDFPAEFYLLNKDCFGRFFYDNPISGEVEYELYCMNGNTFSMTEKKDSVCIGDELNEACISKTDFFNGYGKPIQVSKVNHGELKFKIQELGKLEDSVDLGMGMNLGRFQFTIKRNQEQLYDRIYRCNQILSFDSSNIQVYSPVTHPNIYFVDGINSCLVMEMSYFDEVGDFAGWERFAADIKHIAKLEY